MSGGYFNYAQYKIGNIADSIDHLIRNNDNDELTDYGGRKFTPYQEHIIEEFKKAVEYLRVAEIYAQRIDWLLSGDDGEKCFITRLKEDLEKYYANHRD